METTETRTSEERTVRTIYVDADDGVSGQSESGRYQFVGLNFETDDPAVRAWILAEMNGETDRPRLSTNQFHQLLLEVEFLSEKTGGELTPDLERLFDAAPEALAEKIDGLYWFREQLRKMADLARERAAVQRARVKINERTAERITELISFAVKAHGEIGHGKNGDLWRMKIPSGTATVSQAKDSVIWPAGFRTATSMRVRRVVADGDDLVIRIPRSEMPLDEPMLLKFRVDAEIDENEIRDDRDIAGMIPDGVRFEPAFSVRVTLPRRNGGEEA